MAMYAGLDVGGKRTAVCVVDESGKIIWCGMVDTHPEFIDAALKQFHGQLAKVGLETGPFTPHCFARWPPGPSDGLHGRAPGRGCDQEPSHQE